MQVANMYSNPPPNISNQSPLSTNTNANQSFQPLQFKPFKPPDGEFDGKRLRKSVMRKTVDYNSSIVQMLEARIWQRDERDRPALPADVCYASHILPPPAYLTNPINAVVSKFVRSSTNKAKCPIFCLAWTPEGRRLVTGASSGEFTLWNGLTFNFETILQAHESSVRAMVWSHNDQWMVTGDTSGYVKYWQSNMNNVKMFQAHKDPVRGLSFSPTDLKLASGSDDGTVRIWDFFRCQEEKVLIGHGSDVKCVDWHPSKSLLASGSKDNQQPIKLWDPRSGSSLAQLHAHKSTVMDLKWNSNGMWLCSASRDHLLKLFDIRNLSTELQVFRGHKKEASSIAWHPQHEGLFASGGSDGSILFWHVGNDKEVGSIESAHDGIIWDLAWHPLGHLLCSGSNDHSSKFWTRNRPGDKMRDKYNLNTLPPGVVGDDCVDIDDIPVNVTYMPSAAIPGMGPDDKVEAEPEPKGPETIPGLDFDSLAFERFLKKTPYAKPIPKTFQAAWNAAGGLDEDMEEDQSITSWVIVESENLFSKPVNNEGDPVITESGEELPPGSVLLSEVKANAIAYFGFYIPLPEVSGDKIQDAFAFCEEEEAIAEITSDVDFARKLIREKKGLFNPSVNQSDDSKPDTDVKKENFHKSSQHQQNQHPPPHHYHPAHQHFNPHQHPHPQQMHPQQFQKQHPPNEVQFNEHINKKLNSNAEGWSPGPNPNFKRVPGNFGPPGPPVFRPPNSINQASQNNHGFIRPPLDFRRGGPPPMGMFPFPDGNVDQRPFNNSNNNSNNNTNFNNREENTERGRSYPNDDHENRMRGGIFMEEGRERSRGGRYMDEGRRERGEGIVEDGEERGRDFRIDDRIGDRGRQRGRGRGAGRNFNRDEEGRGFNDRRRPYNNNREENFDRGRGGRDQHHRDGGRQNYNNEDNRSYNNRDGGNERSYYREENNMDEVDNKGGRGWGRGGGAKNFRNRPGRDYDEGHEGGRWRDRENPENNYQYGEEDGYGGGAVAGGEEHGNWRDRPRRGRGRGFQGGKNRGRGGGGWSEPMQSKW